MVKEEASTIPKGMDRSLFFEKGEKYRMLMNYEGKKSIVGQSKDKRNILNFTKSTNSTILNVTKRKHTSKNGQA